MRQERVEAAAERRLADEYDAAQERGEVQSVGKPVNVLDGNNKATLPDLGISRKDIHDARQIRDAFPYTIIIDVGRIYRVRIIP